MAVILGPGGPSMATKIATNGLGGPVVAGDHLRRNRLLWHPPRLQDAWVQVITRLGFFVLTGISLLTALQWDSINLIQLTGCVSLIK